MYSLVVSGVGPVSVRCRSSAFGLRLPKRSEEFPSAASEKKPLVPRVRNVLKCVPHVQHVHFPIMQFCGVVDVDDVGNKREITTIALSYILK